MRKAAFREPIDVARALVEDGVAPDASVAFAVRTAGQWKVESAHVCSDGLTDEPIFDLASVTKPMTAVAIARSGLSKVGVEHLLAHRAGLEAHVLLQDRATALWIAAKRRAECQGPIPKEGFPPVYSDLGYLLAGRALAHAMKAPDAGAAIEELVAARLGVELGTARSLAGPDFDRRVRKTEGDIRGRVHDENAWLLAAQGGCGHAGMFGTAPAVVAFGSAVLDSLAGKGGPFGDADLAWLVAERPGGTLRAGFDGKSATDSSAGQFCGPRTFGHLGFTGTSLWIDPDAEAVVVVLTNRVHPTRENVAIRAARPIAHDALFAMAAARRQA